MKNYFILFISIISLTAFVGCSGDDDYTPPNYASFESRSMDLSVEQNSQASFDITVYTADVKGSDRNIPINVVGTSTLNAEAYSVPATVTIPGNSNEGTFTVDLEDNNLSNSGGKLILSLGTTDDTKLVGSPLTLNVSKLCPFDVAGSYTNASEFFETEVPAEVVAGATANQYIAKNLFEDGTDVTFTVNADNTITVPTQNGWVSGTYGQATVTSAAGSKLEPCLGKITLALTHRVAAGSFGVITEVFTKN